MRKPWPWAAAAVGGLAVLLLTVGPLPVGGLDGFTALLGRMAEAVGVRAPRRAEAEALANVLLFVPLGAAAALLVRFRWAVLVLVLLSTCVEVIQLLLPGRTPSVRDIVLNGTGALLGALLGIGLRYSQRFLLKNR